MRMAVSISVLLLMLGIGHGDESSIDKVLGRVKRGAPQTATFIITSAWSEREANTGHSGWHFEGSTMGVKLYPETGRVIRDEDMDNRKRYRVEGVLLEQWYGVFQVWVYEMSEVKDHPPTAEPSAPTNRASPRR